MGVGSWPGLQSFGLVVLGKRNLAHELNGKKINSSQRIKGCKETRWFFFSSWYQAGLWSRAHGWRERESSFFQRERAFKGEREHFQERVSRKAENSRRGGEVCPGYLISAF